MYRVYFEDKFEKRHLIAESSNLEAAHRAFTEYLHDLDIYPPYYRSWINEKGETYIDYSSHSEFGIIVKEK